MKKILISIVSIFSVGAPLFVMAAATPKIDSYLGQLIRGASNLLSQILIFLIALAVVWFIWNVVRYSMSEDEGGKDKAKDQMKWGIIAIAVIVSVWGIVGLLKSAFGLESGNNAPTDLNQMIPGVTQDAVENLYTPGEGMPPWRNPAP